MNLEGMRKRKRELGYSNKRIAELSGVPLGTVQKIFSGATKAPREDTLKYWRIGRTVTHMHRRMAVPMWQRIIWHMNMMLIRRCRMF